jgi:predicted anti-sigma-YlaC factor YlaD
MRCSTCRDALSARLDGEPPAVRSDAAIADAAVDAHVAACADCRAWEADASMITRLARVGGVIPAAGVPTGVLDSTPRPTRARLARVLRVALGVLGAGQVLLGVAQIAGTLDGTMTVAMDGATEAHMMHESAAWNVATGAAYLFIAWRRTRPAAVLPVLSAFVGVLVIISLGDAVDGAVGLGRLATHGPLLAGYLVVIAMSRPSMTFDGPRRALRHPERDRWRIARWEPAESDDDVATLPVSASRRTPPAAVAATAAGTTGRPATGRPADIPAARRAA